MSAVKDGNAVDSSDVANPQEGKTKEAGAVETESALPEVTMADLAEPLRQAAARMADELKGAVEIERVKDMGEAVQRAWAATEPGDVVLLSPACSSFDMYRDYEQRGEHFRSLALEIIQQGRKNC